MTTEPGPARVEAHPPLAPSASGAPRPLRPPRRPRPPRVVAAIAFGANLGEPERTFKRALARLEQVPGVTVLRRSRWHVTKPVGGPVDAAGQPTQPDYLNGVVLVETTLAPRDLLDHLQALEAYFGRDRSTEPRNGPRTLDLDLLFHGDIELDEPHLTLPHPRLEERLFVLEPLAELAPERRLLRAGVTVAERVRALRSPASSPSVPAAHPPSVPAHPSSVPARPSSSLAHLSSSLARPSSSLARPSSSLARPSSSLARPSSSLARLSSSLAHSSHVKGAAPAQGPVRLETVAEARAWCAAARARGATIGFVPTMGALHEGHLELVRRAARENDLAVVSVFVNPLQFNDPRDLERYPRDFEGDARLLASADCALVFTGKLEGFFPEAGPDAITVPPSSVVAPGAAAQGLEGVHRPGHFDGVATIVDRLFDVVGATRAYFGQKDFQQALVVRDVARRRGGPVIVTCPTVREPAGLARSSRNLLLGPEARDEALALSRGLCAARAAWRGGERQAAALATALRAALDSPALTVEYAEIRDPESWTESAPMTPLTRAVALVAAQVGGVRLIDNSVLSEPEPALDSL